QQSRGSVFDDEDVIGFEIAVNDQVLMRKLNRAAYMLEELKALGEGEMVLGAVLGDGDSVDVLHREERLAGVGNSSIEEVGDVRMDQPGEDLTLLQEAVSKHVCCKGQVDQLDGDLLLKLAVHTMR